MATRLVWNGAPSPSATNTAATGPGDPPTSGEWDVAGSTVSAVLANAVDGDLVCVAADHTETIPSNQSWTSPAAAKVIIISINRTTGAYQRQKDSTGAIDCRTNNADVTVFDGVHVEGMRFNINTLGHVILNSNNGSLHNPVLRDCLLDCDTIDFRPTITENDGHCIFHSVEFKSPGVSGDEPYLRFSPTGSAYFLNPLFTGWNFSNTYLVHQSGPYLEIENPDLSTFGSSTTGANLARGINQGIMRVIGGHIHSNVTPTCDSDPDRDFYLEVTAMGQGSSGTGDINTRHDWIGRHYPQTVVTRNSGASKSWRVITVRPDANVPFITLPLHGYVGTGSKTFTVHFAQSHATVQPALLTDLDIWPVLQYKATSNSALRTLSTGREEDPFVAGVSWTEETGEAWTGGSNLRKQRLSTTVTVNEAGVYMLRLSIAKITGSDELYIDPVVEVT